MKRRLGVSAGAMGLLMAAVAWAAEPVAGDSAAPAATADQTPAETSPPTAETPAETGSIEPAAAHPDATIGQAARELLGTGPSVVDGAHLMPQATTDDKEGDGAKAEDVAIETPEEADRRALSEHYRKHHDEPLWVTSAGYSAKAEKAIRTLARANFWGLDPKVYEVPAMATPSGGGSIDPKALAEAETKLSLAVLAYARHARGGLIPDPAKQLSSYLDRHPQWADRSALLDALAAADDPRTVIEALHPKHREFERLRQAWLEARRAPGARKARLGDGDDILPGATHDDVVVLRKRLDIAAETEASAKTLDADLAAALAGFQRLKGLPRTDGTLDKPTRAALNQPIKGKADQLLANMQQWRWMPEDLGALHVEMNAPEFMVRVFKNSEPVFTERVTIGLVNNQTPIFSDEMVRVTFKSRWHVPDSIKVREIWPSLLSGGGLVRQHRLEFVRADTREKVDWTKVDWSKVNMKDYIVYQPPGPWNQLGVVKFSFPNKHYVFMHDTPDKYMFNWRRRANSHGCMRIRNPLDMAAVILGEDQGWDRARVEAAAKDGPEHEIVTLTNKVPVHITYFTVRIGEGGKIETFADIYGHEKRVIQALKGEWSKIQKGRDHLAPLDQAAAPKVAARKPKSAPKTDSVGDLVNSVLGGAFQ
ncbi:MAG: L,D-transpeptidase family protein [Hyphomicrobium sp.]|nr:L,D-transpeptidase family protein [Hyphomicrobium sp.]